MAVTILPTQVNPRDAEAVIVTSDVQDRARLLVMVPHQVINAERDWVGMSLSRGAVLNLINALLDTLD